MTVLIHGESRVALVDWAAAIPVEAWMSDAACGGINRDLMYPGRNDDEAPAKQVCGGCPVRSECLEFALRNNERFGIWGGLSTNERADLRRTRKAAR